MKFMKSTCNESGSITIAAAIILAAVFLLNIVLYDFVILKTNLSRIEPHMKLACNSMLASYDALLAEKYGLYGYNLSSSYLSGKGYDYYFPSMENEVEFLEDFTKPNIIKNQICELMKFKTPTNVIETVLEALDVFESSEKSCDAHSECGEAAELLVEMQKITKKIKINVEGYYNGYVACVNGYNRQICVDIINAYINKQGTDIKQLLNQIISVQEQYYNYNIATVALFSEQYSIYEKIISKITSAQKKGTADISSLEIAENVQTLLNKKAQLEINSNVELLTKRITALKQYLDIKDLKIEEIKKMFFDDKVNTNIKINDVASSSSGAADERNNIKNDIINASKESFFSGSKYEIPRKDYAMLPSVTAKKKIESQRKLYEINNADFMDSFSSFSDIFSYWDNISVGKITTDIKNKILIDDYILSYMTNRIDGSSDKKLNNEIEFIIGGDASSNANNNTVEQKILMMRFVLNFADIMADKEKCAIAESMAVALAAIISMGAGVSLYKYIIISSWALIDSYMDVNTLLEGKSVPIVSVGDDDSYINEIQNYSFYLRLLLLFMDEETKLLRISDVIQLNMQEFTGEEYKLNGVYSKIKVTATTKIEFIFPLIIGEQGVYRREDEYELSY